MSYFGPTTMGGTPYGDCVSGLGGVDLYGDCDYLIPLYGTPVSTTVIPNATNSNTPQASTNSFVKDFEAWFAKGDNKTLLMFGGALLVILLTKKR